MYLSGYNHWYNVIDLLIAIMFIPLRIYTHFWHCSETGMGACLFWGLEEVIFASPIYFGIIGFLLGFIIDKIKSS